jgi:hypothetical protein
VRLKIFPAAADNGRELAPLPTARTIFAHLKLQTDAIEARALEQTPTLHSIECAMPEEPPTFVTASIAAPHITC